MRWNLVKTDSVWNHKKCIIVEKVKSRELIIIIRYLSCGTFIGIAGVGGLGFPGLD